jgi:hypothetical protein
MTFGLKQYTVAPISLDRYALWWWWEERGVEERRGWVCVWVGIVSDTNLNLFESVVVVVKVV